MSTRVEQLRTENDKLRQRVAQIQAHQNNNDLQAKVTTFVESSKKNLADMNQKIMEEHSQQNNLLHTLTANYEAVLKKQIELLNENKLLTAQKDQQEKVFN